MSGGSYDYLYYQIEEEPLGWSTLYHLNDMAKWLESEGQTEAATELKELHAYLVKTEKEIQAKLSRPLLDVIKEAEWWASNDSGQRDFEEIWNEYKNSKNEPNSQQDSQQNPQQ